MRKILMAAFLFALLGTMVSFLACSGDDDDDNDSADDADDTAADDTAADDTAADDATDDATDDAADDTADDDTTDYNFAWETVDALTPPGVMVSYGSLMGHDVLAAMAFLSMSGVVVDAVEWDMIDGVPAGDYSFHIDEGEDLPSDSTNQMSVIFGLNALTQAYDMWFVSVEGDATITATGVVGDTFTAEVTGMEFRPMNPETGEIDWDSYVGTINTWSISKTIVGLGK